MGSNQDEQRLQPEGVEIVIVLEVALPPLQNPSASIHVLEIFPVRHDAFLNRKGVLEMTYREIEITNHKFMKESTLKSA